MSRACNQVDMNHKIFGRSDHRSFIYCGIVHVPAKYVGTPWLVKSRARRASRALVVPGSSDCPARGDPKVAAESRVKGLGCLVGS